MLTDSDITCLSNPSARDEASRTAATAEFAPEVARQARRFHASLPGYQPTPLVSLDALAAELGVTSVWIKDESKRFGLNAFKVLGASHAVLSEAGERLGLEPNELSRGAPDEPSVRSRLREITVCTATDGNHGRAVAWAGERLGCRSVVYMPAGTAEARIEAVSSHGAVVRVLDCSYDDAVRRAALEAQRNEWLLIQDTAWPGYERVPRRIMQGYLTILEESMEQLRGQVPTHVLVQAGVGSLAGAIQGHLCELMGGARPVLAVVEPTQAACCYASMAAGEREPVSLAGELSTIMAGLACGTPSTLAWDILREHADVFVACSDAVAEAGMRALSSPLPGDPPLVSGESGAVTMGLLVSVLAPASRAVFADAVEALMLDVDSRVLLISTEGATDPATYHRIVSR